MTQMTPTLTTATAADELVVPFHCDRCGALAKVRVVLANGSDLVFCGHHAREYESKLRDIAVDIIETDGEQRVTA
jgi:hypothetical protein